MNKFNLIMAASLIGFSSVATAWQGHSARHGDYQPHQERFEYARVIDVRPIFREVRISEPVEECWQEPVRHQVRHGGPSAGGMLAGGIVGGIIGHHLGQGRKHRGVATAVGTLVGARIGHEAVKHHGPDYSYSEVTEMQQSCSQYERVRYHQEIDGYDVTYKYKGRKYQIEMPYDPGKRIKMRIHVEPVI